MTSIQSYRIKMQRTRAESNTNPTVVKVDVDRYLTNGEIAMAKLVFKDAIDYRKVRIIRGGFFGIPSLSGNAMVINGYIHLPSKEYDSIKDFSTTKRAAERHWFIHEMTHIWQYQMGTNTSMHGIAQLRQGGYTSTLPSPDKQGDDYKAYVTDISGADANKKFNEFNFEQQGRIIEIWYDACYLQNHDPHRRHHQQSLKLLGYAERILRDFLHNPKDKNLLPKV